MDWLPLSDRLFDFWPFLAWGATTHNRHDDDPNRSPRDEVEVHTPGDRWGWLKVGGNSTLIITQFVVIAVVYVQFEQHERHAAERAISTSKGHEAQEALLLQAVIKEHERTRDALKVVIDNQTLIIAIGRAADEENRNQTFIMTLTESQKRELNLAMPDSLKDRRKR